MLYIKTMSRFLRLTNMLLNVNQIRLIEISPDKYTIRMNSHHINGIVLFGSGWFDSYNHNFDCCKKEHSKDYKIISDWLEQEENNNGKMK
jgi:hypothetical protein